MRAWARAAAAVAGLAMSGLAGAQGTVTDQAVSLTYLASHWDGSPGVDLQGTTASGSPLLESSWWYWAEDDDYEVHLPAPDTQTYQSGIITSTWNDVRGTGFKVIESTIVFDNEGPSGGFISRLGIQNNNATTRTFRAYHYLDPNLSGGAGDSALGLSPRAIRFTGGVSTALYRASTPFLTAVKYQVGAFPTVRNILNDTSIDTLSGGGLPFGPGDATAAFEFGTYAAPPGVLLEVGDVSFFVNLPADAKVKGDVTGLGSFPSLHGQNAGLTNAIAAWMRRTEMLPSGGFYLAIPNGAALVAVDDFLPASYNATAVSRNPVTGETYVGTSLITGAPILPLNWKVSATGDFNGDGKPDIVWRNVTSQKIVIWTMSGNQKTGTLIPTPDQAANSNWEIAGAADFNADGDVDFLWYNQTSGKLVLWYLNGTVRIGAGVFTNPASVGNNNWRVVAVGDFGKGPAQYGTPILGTQDIVWQNDTSLKVVVWHMDHAANRTGGVFTTPDSLPAGYRIVGPR